MLRELARETSLSISAFPPAGPLSKSYLTRLFTITVTRTTDNFNSNNNAVALSSVITVFILFFLIRIFYFCFISFFRFPILFVSLSMLSLLPLFIFPFIFSHLLSTTFSICYLHYFLFFLLLIFFFSSSFSSCVSYCFSAPLFPSLFFIAFPLFYHFTLLSYSLLLYNNFTYNILIISPLLSLFLSFPSPITFPLLFYYFPLACNFLSYQFSHFSYYFPFLSLSFSSSLLLSFSPPVSYYFSSLLLSFSLYYFHPLPTSSSLFFLPRRIGFH